MMREAVTLGAWGASMAAKPSNWVFVEWRDPGGLYHGGSYRVKDYEPLVTRLRAQGVVTIWVDEKETKL